MAWLAGTAGSPSGNSQRGSQKLRPIHEVRIGQIEEFASNRPLFEGEFQHSLLDIASTNVHILCGAQVYCCLQHFAMRTSNVSKSNNIASHRILNGGMFGECHVFVTHYNGAGGGLCPYSALLFIQALC